jgi:hypothetical protein
MASPRSPLERIVGWREVELETGISTGLALVPEILPWFTQRLGLRRKRLSGCRVVGRCGRDADAGNRTTAGSRETLAADGNCCG